MCCHSGATVSADSVALERLHNGRFFMKAKYFTKEEVHNQLVLNRTRRGQILPLREMTPPPNRDFTRHAHLVYGEITKERRIIPDKWCYCLDNKHL